MPENQSNESERLLFRSEIFKVLPWDEVCSRTKTELYIWAWSGHAAMSERTRNALRSLLSDGKTINFMILNPASMIEASRSISFAPVCSWEAEEVRVDIASGRDQLVKFKALLKPDDQARFIIKETSWFMAWSGLAIDPELDNGLLQIENYLYDYGDVENIHLDFRPNLLLTTSSRFYKPYWYSIKKMWAKAFVIP